MLVVKDPIQALSKSMENFQRFLLSVFGPSEIVLTLCSVVVGGQGVAGSIPANLELNRTLTQRCESRFWFAMCIEGKVGKG